MRRFYLILGIFLALVLFLLLSGLPPAYQWIFTGGAALLLLATLAAGASVIRSQVYVKAVCRGPGRVNRVALTFDDGPHPVQSRVIMELLEQHGCPSSFFLTGSKIAAHENIIREMAARGHTLGNHSFSHSSRFPLMAPKRIAAEIKETNRLLEQAGGHPVRFFRPPFGVTNPRIHRGLQGQDLVVVGWSIRSYDTCKGSPEKVVARIMERVRGGDIILLHETSDHIAEILELLLPQLRNKGLECVSLETLLGDR